MKRLFALMMLGAAVALSSCSKTDADKGGSGKEVNVTITANVQTASATRVTPVVIPTGCKVRYIMEIYKAGTTQLATPRIAQFGNVFNLRLVGGQTYDFVTWADFVPAANADATVDNAFYTTAGGLKSIALTAAAQTSYAGNDPSRDAFFHSEPLYVDYAFYADFTLKRPFAQIRVRTTDMAAVKGTSFEPKQVSINYSGNTLTSASKKFYTAFDASTGIASAPAATPPAFSIANIAAAPYPSTSDDPTWDGWISFDYFLANTAGDDLVDFVLTFADASGTAITTKNITAIPIAQNTRTTVYGNLLTVGGTINLIIDPGFTGDNPQPVVALQTMKDLQAVLNAYVATVPAPPMGSISCLVNDVDTPTLTIPAGITAANVPYIVVYVNGDIGKSGPFTVTGATYDGTVIFHLLNGASAASDLTVNLPAGDFTIDGDINNLTATTKPNTLTIAQTGNVKGNLAITDSNVEIYGTVAGTITATNGKVFWGVRDEASLRAAFTKPAPNDGVVFMNNIAGVSSEVLLPAATSAGYVIDGKGYTLSGNTSTPPSGTSKNMLTVCPNGAIVKNLTVTNAGGNGLVAYVGTGIVFDNVAVKNNSQAGAIIIGAGVTITGTFTSGGNVWGAINITKGSGGGIPDPSLAIDAAAVVNITEATKIWADYAGATPALAPAGWYCSTMLFGRASYPFLYFMPGTGTTAMIGLGASYGGILTGNTDASGNPVLTPNGSAGTVAENPDGTITIGGTGNDGPFLSINSLVSSNVISWKPSGITAQAGVYIDPATLTSTFGVDITMRNTAGTYATERRINFTKSGAVVNVVPAHPPYPGAPAGSNAIYQITTAGWYTAGLSFYENVADGMMYCKMFLLDQNGNEIAGWLHTNLSKTNMPSYPNYAGTFAEIGGPGAFWFLMNGNQINMKSILVYER